jgi:rsbT co-antagonist protein RsbR
MARNHELQRGALRDGDWGPYLEHMRNQGMSYAKMGISFVDWYDLIAIYREAIRGHLLLLSKDDLALATRYSDAVGRAVDIVMANVAEAYIHAKEEIIELQQVAIREQSIPVLQVRAHMLVIPLVGVLDASRARLLIENLLRAIRDRRAHAVVIDVTGVPIVDTNVANHLVQAVEAARLMGATVAITGMSPEIAQTLVALGARLPNAETHIDLQEGIEQIERSLALR